MLYLSVCLPAASLYDGRSGDPNGLDCATVSDWGDDEDKWLCSTPCTPQSPCLFDVENDLGERVDLAGQMPEMVQRMLARLRELQKGFWSAPMMQDNGRFCAQMETNGGFYGPWINETQS